MSKSRKLVGNSPLSFDRRENIRFIESKQCYKFEVFQFYIFHSVAFVVAMKNQQFLFCYSERQNSFRQVNLLPLVRQQLLGLLVPIGLENGTMVDCMVINQNIPGHFVQLNLARLHFYRPFKILLLAHIIWAII